MSTEITQPLSFKEGLELLNQMSLIEFAVESSISGDNGPLTSSPTTRRNLSLILNSVSEQLASLSEIIDPLSDSNQVTWAPAQSLETL